MHAHTQKQESIYTGLPIGVPLLSAVKQSTNVKLTKNIMIKGKRK